MNAFGDTAGDLRFDEQERDEIEECGPGHGRARSEHSRRHDRRNGICGVMKAVDEIEYERDEDDGGESNHHAYSSTMPSRMFATSSQRSVAASRLSTMSRHFMTVSAS